MPKSIEAWVSLQGKFYRVFIKQTQKKTSNHSNSLLALEQQRERWWGKVFFSLLCPRVLLGLQSNDTTKEKKQRKLPNSQR